MILKGIDGKMLLLLPLLLIPLLTAYLLLPCLPLVLTILFDIAGDDDDTEWNFRSNVLVRKARVDLNGTICRQDIMII